MGSLGLKRGSEADAGEFFNSLDRFCYIIILGLGPLLLESV
jgi:hypothetical protein